VAIRLRVVSFSGASDSITFHRPLNSSVSVMSFMVSGVIVMFHPFQIQEIVPSSG
jgi:hypothetical protein